MNSIIEDAMSIACLDMTDLENHSRNPVEILDNNEVVHKKIPMKLENSSAKVLNKSELSEFVAHN